MRKFLLEKDKTTNIQFFQNYMLSPNFVFSKELKCSDENTKQKHFEQNDKNFVIFRRKFPEKAPPGRWEADETKLEKTSAQCLRDTAIFWFLFQRKRGSNFFLGT